MKPLFQVVKSSARVGYAALAWALAGLVVVQVFYAGHAVLVNPGDWAAHRTLGDLFSPPIFAMFVFALLGLMPGRFVLYSVALFVLYSLQYLFLFLPAPAWRSCGHSTPLTQSAAVRSEQFLMWAVSEGSARGMPAWKSQLSEQERWYVVAFIKSLVGHGPVE